MKSREICLAARPAGVPKPSDFRLEERDLPEPGEGEVLVQNLLMSVDPYMRGRMNDVKSYTPPFAVGKPLEGGAAGRVLRSNFAGLAAGDIVLNNFGWREAFIAPGKGLSKVDTSLASVEDFLGVLGMPGLTAYAGLLDIGRPKAGETVFVSAAAGAVGSVAGQIARIKGCRVVGSAGSQAKLDYLRELGFDAAFNYHEVDLERALDEHCPNGIDIYFENVGGDHLQAALNHMNPMGRIPVCGMISQYNNDRPVPGPNNLTNIVRSRLLVQGFLVSDYVHLRAAFNAEMAGWLKSGQVRGRVTVVDGIEHAAEALIGLLQGENIGKMLVRLST